jgi:hypothetical protein
VSTIHDLSHLANSTCRRFRWADLQIKRLQDCSTEDDFCIALNTLPESLEATYREALETVSERDRERVLHILAWLTSSFRELRSSEVAAVVAYPFADDVYKLCKSILITVIDEVARTLFGQRIPHSSGRTSGRRTMVQVYSKSRTSLYHD